MISNYEKQVDIGKAHFLKYDQEALSAKFHLDLDKDYIYLTYLNTPCKIDRPSGTVFEKTSDGFAECRSYETVMKRNCPLLAANGLQSQILLLPVQAQVPKFFHRNMQISFPAKWMPSKRHVFPSAGF